MSLEDDLRDLYRLSPSFRYCMRHADNIWAYPEHQELLSPDDPEPMPSVEDKHQDDDD